MTSIEPTAGAINDMCVFGESGLMLLALDTSQIPSYFLPALGPAPKWCSYLENLTVCHTNITDYIKFYTSVTHFWSLLQTPFYGCLYVGRDGGRCTNYYL